MWHRIAEIIDDDCGFRQVGHLKIAETPADIEPLHAVAKGVRDHCTIAEQHLDQAGMRAREPHLSNTCVAGIFSPECGFALPARTVQAFRRKAESLGAVFREHTEVTGVSGAGGAWQVQTASECFRAAILVNGAGAWGDRIAAWAGEPVVLTPLALMMTVLAPMKPLMHTVIGLTRRRLSIKQFPNGTVVIGGGYTGTPDLESGLAHLDYGLLGYNLRAAAEVYPALRSARVIRCWAGLEGKTEDGLPVIGPSSTQPGLWHAFGFSQHGFYLGPAVGHVLAELIVSNNCVVPVQAMNIVRFQGAAQHRATAR
jgi:sarcosine oxidase subunit beta